MIDRLDDKITELPELRELPREAPLPPGLEERVVQALRREGLLEPGAAGRKAYRLIAALAAASVLFVSGWALGASRSGGDAEPEATFVLLLREGATYRQPAEAEVMQRVNEYRNWARAQHAAGTGISGLKLTGEIALVRDSGAVELYSREQAGAAPGAVTGFFLIHVPDYDRALDVVRSCPHLRYGGAIELRRIDPV